jgi:hypothetical protein
LIKYYDFNRAFCPFAGIGLTAFANFSSIQSPVGIQGKLIIGWMNRKKPIAATAR